MCGDGSPFHFWMRQRDPQKVLLYFEGGGACFSAETCNPSDPAYKTAIGHDETLSDLSSGIWDDTNPENPFRDWSVVFVPYCTGDVHIGNNTADYGNGITVEHKGYVNGVAALHTQLLKAQLFPEFDALYPGKFQNKTNGITPRRWLLKCNPRLAGLINRTIGDQWPRDIGLLHGLEKHAGNAAFQREFMAIKRANKVELAARIAAECGVEVSPDALFDVQIKRLHEYKRQHLNLLHIMALYRRLLLNPGLDIVPRVFVFAAKAAPGYDLAKNIIRAINVIGAHINADIRIGGKLKVAFLPNYRVSLAERIIPAADLSEQISTAGKEASGTGNMKLSLNGALTIGTLDGANVEIREEVGPENIFIFGLDAAGVQRVQAEPGYASRAIAASPRLRAALDMIAAGGFSAGEPGRFRPLVDELTRSDRFLLTADFDDYWRAQREIDAAWRRPRAWWRAAILNTARTAWFSSDRTIEEYVDRVWSAKSLG